MSTIKVSLYSDGSSRGNPGPGGFGTILRYTDLKEKHSNEKSRKGTPTPLTTAWNY